MSGLGHQAVWRTLCATVAVSVLLVPASAGASGCAAGPAHRASIDRPHVVDGSGDTNFPAALAAAAPAAVGQFDIGRIWVSEPSARAFAVNIELAASPAAAPVGYSVVTYVSEAQWVSARREADGWLFQWGNTPAGTVASGDAHVVRGNITGVISGDVLTLALPKAVLPDLDGATGATLPRLLVATGTSVPLPSDQFLLRPIADTSFDAIAQCAVVLVEPKND